MLIRIAVFAICLSGVCLPIAVAQASDDGIKLVISPQGPLYKPIGENMYLRCTLVPESAKGAVQNIRWLNPKGDLIGDSTREGDRLYSQSSDQISNQLYIMQLLKEDGGDYACIADFPGHDQLKTTVTIDVFQDVQFEDAQEIQNPVSGSVGKIKCEVSGNPAPEVDWLRDNMPIPVGERYKVDTDGLAITDINQDDDGEYTCRAVVGITGRLLQRKIKVEVFSKPEFQDGGEPQDVRGIEQRTVSLICGVTGRPVPDVTWVFVPTGDDVLKLQDEQNTNHHSVDPTTGTLTINDLLKRHEGDYKCIARNPAGEAERTANVKVIERPRFDIVSNATESEGTSATIKCTVRGDPAPSLHFIKEGAIVPFAAGADPRFIVTELERELTLTINQLAREDDGLYVCRANNEAGTEEKSSHITVKFKPSFQNTPMHVAKTWIGNEEPVNLTCIAESIPNATIRWEKKQRNSLTGAPFLLITDQMENMKVEQRGPSSSLLISPRIPEDFGEYECIALNELGEARHIITLYQATLPGPMSLVDFAIVTATSITFNLAGPSEPNNLDLEGFEVYYHEAGGDFSNAMSRFWPIGVPYTLDKLKPSHRYFFRFYAKNRIGVGQESRDFERNMPDIGPPRPPGYFPPTNETLDSNRYRLQWQEPEDNGARLLDYQVKYWKDGEKERARTQTVPAPATSFILTGLQPSTRYNVELSARNDRGMGPALNFTFTSYHAQSVSSPKVDPADSGMLLSTPVIAGIIVGALLLLLLLIDLGCYCTARRGLTAFICRRICGQSKSLKEDVETEKHRTVDETCRVQEKSSPFIRLNGSSPVVNGNSLNGGYSNGTLLGQSDEYSRDSDTYQVGVTRTSSMGSLQQLETDV